MTLATRCPACGTVFRVVPDQLRVSQGWVRCGRCNEAFNAIEAMVQTPPPAEPVDQQEASATHATVSELEVHALLQSPAAPAIHLDRTGPSDSSGPVDSVLPASWSAEAPPTVSAEPPDGAPPAAAAPPLSSRPPPTDDVPAATPSFVRAAERAERWRRPWVRRTLALGVVLSACGLAAQAALAFRDRLAASSPALKPALQRACAWAGCRIDEYRQIEALSVETSGLVRVEGSPVYRFSITLRNRAAHEVAAPAIDLSLTDAQGRAIARRVLRMADLNLPLRALKPGSELPIQVPLGIQGQVAGYTVEIFYP